MCWLYKPKKKDFMGVDTVYDSLYPIFINQFNLSVIYLFLFVSWLVDNVNSKLGNMCYSILLEKKYQGLVAWEKCALASSSPIISFLFPFY